jgi:excisionase family DNA binding protein
MLTENGLQAVKKVNHCPTSRSPFPDGRSLLEPLISTKKLAALLDVGEGTVRGWVLHRKIPFHKLGKLVRFRASEVMGWVQCGRTEAAVPGVLPESGGAA